MYSGLLSLVNCRRSSTFFDTALQIFKIGLDEIGMIISKQASGRSQSDDSIFLKSSFLALLVKWLN